MQIKGVSLRTVDANPAGIVGTPDIHTEDTAFSLIAYPNPAVNSIGVYIKNTDVAGQLRIRLFHVWFADAPATAIIENKALVGTWSRDITVALPVTSGFTYQIDVADLPRGFYRLYAETDKGTAYWDNVWLMR